MLYINGVFYSDDLVVRRVGVLMNAVTLLDSDSGHMVELGRAYDACTSDGHTVYWSVPVCGVTVRTGTVTLSAESYRASELEGLLRGALAVGLRERFPDMPYRVEWRWSDHPLRPGRHRVVRWRGVIDVPARLVDAGCGVDLSGLVWRDVSDDVLYGTNGDARQTGVSGPVAGASGGAAGRVTIIGDAAWGARTTSSAAYVPFTYPTSFGETYVDATDVATSVYGHVTLRGEDGDGAATLHPYGDAVRRETRASDEFVDAVPDVADSVDRSGGVARVVGDRLESHGAHVGGDMTAWIPSSVCERVQQEFAERVASLEAYLTMNGVRDGEDVGRGDDATRHVADDARSALARARERVREQAARRRERAQEQEREQACATGRGQTHTVDGAQTAAFDHERYWGDRARRTHESMQERDDTHVHSVHSVHEAPRSSWARVTGAQWNALHTLHQHGVVMLHETEEANE